MSVYPMVRIQGAPPEDSKDGCERNLAARTHVDAMTMMTVFYVDFEHFPRRPVRKWEIFGKGTADPLDQRADIATLSPDVVSSSPRPAPISAPEHGSGAWMPWPTGGHPLHHAASPHGDWMETGS